MLSRQLHTHYFVFLVVLVSLGGVCVFGRFPRYRCVTTDDCQFGKRFSICQDGWCHAIYKRSAGSFEQRGGAVYDICTSDADCRRFFKKDKHCMKGLCM